VFAYGIPQNEAEVQKMQDVHGPWEYQGLEKQYELYNQGRSLLHSEFGVESITNLPALNRTIPAEQQWPVSLNNPVWEHLGSWWVKESVWQEVFGGPFKDLQEAQRATQFLQADGLRYAVEADRRRMYQNGGTMPWQFNEPYPMAACTSAVDYYAVPKPVYYSVARAYRPLSVTARFATLAWGGKSGFTADIWTVNAETEQKGELTAQVIALDGRNIFDRTIPVTCGDNRAQQHLQVSVPLEQIKGDLFFLDIALWGEAGGHLASNRYLFNKTDSLAPMLSTLPAARVNARVEKTGKTWLVTLENTAASAALWLWLEAEKPDLRSPGCAYFEDNYFCLLPGEQRAIKVRWSGIPDAERKIRVSGWNFAGVVIE
jgi:beta-mannosidase